MKIRTKLSMIVILIMAAVVAVISIIQLTQSSRLQMETTREKQAFLAEWQSAIIQDRYDGYMRVAKTLAGVFSEYETVTAANRRARFLGNIEAVLKNEPNVAGIYSVWKPNVLDNDAEHIGTLAAAPNGQFAPFYNKYEGANRITRTYLPDYADRARNLPDKEMISEPAPRRIAGKDTFVIRVTAPVIAGGQIVAEVGMVIDIAALQEVVLKTIKDYDEISYMAVYTNVGSILASYQPDRVGKNIRETDTQLFTDHMNEVADAIKAGNRITVEEFSPLLNSDLTVTLAPFIIGETGVPWAVGIGTPHNIILEDVKALTKLTIVIAAVSILVMAVVIFLVVSRIVKPIINVTLTLKDISEGEGDLTKTIKEHGKDEVADLAKYFNLTLGKIRGLVAVIKKQAAALFDIGTELAANMTESAAAINEITANIQNIKSRAINQSASVTETNATMEQITINIDKLNSQVEHQSQSVAQSSSAIEEMLANIQSVTQTLIKNSGNVHVLMEASEVGRTGLQEVASDIQEIARESEGLLEINGVMENIASQTNLLSMNAAIEAAHAGEAGKGFAVVAGEIRKLAESSSKQSKTIGTVLKKIKESIDKITRSTDNVLNKFEAIDSGVKTVADQEENIRNAMEEQGAGSKQILDAIGQLNEITQQVKGGSEEMLEGSKEVIQESKNLEMVTQELSGGLNEMATGAEQINSAINRVNELTGQNRDNIDTLVREVSRFKIE